MRYIVIELFPTPFICVDEEGNIKIFDNRNKAQGESDDCQDGLIVEIN